MIRGYRYKLAPTPEQESTFRQFAGVCRLVYNLGLEQRRDFWRQYRRAQGEPISFASQCRELTKLRAEFDWIAAVTATCQNQALRDLDKAYSDFFKGRAKYPTPRRKGVNESFRFKGKETRLRQINAKWAMVLVPKIGWVRLRYSRPVRGTIKNATVSLDATGWHISFACESDLAAPAISALPAVGIDRGIANTLSLSTGEHMQLPVSLRPLELRLRQAKRTLSRRKRGSRRRLRALRRAAKISAKCARIRRDWHHRVALDITRRFGTVVMEDLKVANMTASAAGTVAAPGRNVGQKAGLNRSILNQGWYAFETILAYKLEERGGTLVKVPAAYTSQTCSSCGTIDSRSRESQARFACQHCGFEIHADHNAALNILRGNTAWLRMEAGRQAAVEVRTGVDREVHENHLAMAG
jgi:putative transposase